MKNTFINVFGIKITHKPFYQKSVNTWRVARYEDEKLDMVYENRSFATVRDCMQYIHGNILFKYNNQ